MILPEGLDEERAQELGRDAVIDKLVEESGYDREAAGAIADALLGDGPALA